VTVEEYRSTIAVKAKNYIELFKVQDAFSLVTDGKVVRNAYCLPQAFYIYRMEDATTEKVQQLQQLLLNVDETLIPCVSYVYKLQGNSYVLSEAYFLWRRDAEKENSMGHYTEPIFYKEKAPIIPYYIVDAYGVIMEYADIMKPTIKDIWENIDIDTKMLIQILSLWHLWQQKPEVVQAYVKYSTFERKDEIAQYFNNLFLADIETDNEKINSFALWLEEQKDSTIRIAQSVIDTATMYSELQIQNNSNHSDVRVGMLKKDTKKNGEPMQGRLLYLRVDFPFQQIITALREYDLPPDADVSLADAEQIILKDVISDYYVKVNNTIEALCREIDIAVVV